MWLHTRVAAENGANHMVSGSPGTDVLVLLLHQRSSTSEEAGFFFHRKGK